MKQGRDSIDIVRFMKLLYFLVKSLSLYLSASLFLSLSLSLSRLAAWSATLPCPPCQDA
jgi:hypothetical protein